MYSDKTPHPPLVVWRGRRSATPSLFEMVSASLGPIHKCQRDLITILKVARLTPMVVSEGAIL